MEWNSWGEKDRGGHWKHRRPRTTAAEEERRSRCAGDDLPGQVGWPGETKLSPIGAATGNIGGRERRPPKKSDVTVARETTCRGKLRGRGKRSFPRSGRPLETSAAENDGRRRRDRKSTRLNSSHTVISYAVF